MTDILEGMRLARRIAQQPALQPLVVRETRPGSGVQDDAALLHLGEDKFLERVQSYVDLAPALRQRVPEIDYVDLRFDERVYVRPVGEKK